MMPFSSFVIRTQQDKTQQVADRLKSYRETVLTEIYSQNVVLVTETQTRSQDHLLWEKIQHLPGVLQCDLIYHNFEDEEGFSHD
jgi:nitrate reductase NapAB chaperone NapD